MKTADFIYKFREGNSMKICVSKKFLSLVLALCLIFSAFAATEFSVSAEEATAGKTGDCNWFLNGTELTISSAGGSGRMADYENWGIGVPWGYDITSLKIEPGVTYIGKYAFYNFVSLTELSLPDTVTEIADWALYGCNNIVSTVDLNNVKKIGENGLSGCFNLRIIADRGSYAYKYAHANYLNVIENTSWIGELNNPAVSIEVPDVKIIENTHGIMKDGYYYYFYAEPFTYTPGAKCIVAYKDGEKEYSYAAFDSADLEKQDAEHWTAGNTYKVKATFGELSCTVNISVIANPIAKVSVSEVTAEEGFFDNDYGFEETSTWDFPKYTVTLKNGTVLTPEYGAHASNYVTIEGEEYEFNSNLDEVNVYDLKAGESTVLRGEVAGVSVDYKLNVVESPFKSFEVEDVVATKQDEFYGYPPKKITVSLKNGETLNLTEQYFEYNGKNYSIEYHKQTDDSLESGKTYDFEAYLGNLVTTYKVTIPQPQGTEDISLTDAEIISNPDKTEYIVGERFDPRGAVIRVSYSDGTTEDLKVSEVKYDYSDLNVFSEKLSTYLRIEEAYYSEGSGYVSSADMTDTDKTFVRLEIYIPQGDYHRAELNFPVTVTKCTWKSVEIADYNTVNPKAVVTKEDGSTVTLNIIETGMIGGAKGGGDPWFYNSIEGEVALVTDGGMFNVDYYQWIDGGKCSFNMFFNNREIKSNTVDGEVFGYPKTLLEQKCYDIVYGDIPLAFERPGKVKFENGMYYLEKDYIYSDGTVKTLYASFDKDFNLLKYNFGIDKEKLDGDANGDGIMDISDAILAARVDLGEAEISPERIKKADVNGDGKVTVHDALLLVRFSLGLIDKFPTVK